jgi:REP element-mobilizing transposase RayT
MARTPSGRLLFRDDQDRRVYLRLFGEQVVERVWQVFSYCQMTNHLHLLLRTPEPNLSDGIKAVHEAFAMYVNRKYGEKGHLFGAPYRNKLVRTDQHFFGCLRYIARNPVAAGMCTTASDWQWGAHAALAGAAHAPTWLDVDAALQFFDEEPHAARIAYQELAAAGEHELLATLETPRSWAWLESAVDDFQVDISTIASYLGVARRTVYARLARARALH